MNPIDVVIGALCLSFLVLGIIHGFIRQAVSWAGLFLGHLLGTKYHAVAVRFIKLDFRYGDVLGYLCVFVAVYLAVRLLGMLIEQWARASKLSGTNRLAGGAAGLLKGALLSILLVLFLVIFLPRDSSLLKESKLAPRATDAARWLVQFFPERMGSVFREKLPAVAPARGKTEAEVPSQSKNRSRK